MNKRIKLVQTCGACPEQYNVFVDGEPLGYMRLRHGYFRAEYRDEIVFSCEPRGDGSFYDDERQKWLNKACQAILEAHDQMPVEVEPLYEMEYEQGKE